MTKTCQWCDGQVHAKCWKGDLGYISCCEKIFQDFTLTSMSCSSLTALKIILYIIRIALAISLCKLVTFHMKRRIVIECGVKFLNYWLVASINK